MLEMITFVRVVFSWNGLPIMYSIPTMSSGMVRIVHPPAHAISSTTLHAWFTKNLPTPTTDDIGLRICVANTPSTEDVPLELIELYVQ